MKRKYWEYLKENDPIHYAEMMGDPVTGQKTDSNPIFSILAILFGFSGVIGWAYFIYKAFIL